MQIDDAFLPYMHERMVPPMTSAEYRRWAQLRVDALNHALRGIPEERSRYHICWGSWNGPHAFDVPLKDIIDLVLQVRAGHYSFEAANPRHAHEWRVWETVKLPPGKILIPGVISHATNIVEHPELVAERIVRLAKIVGRENVMGGTDCGFAQSPFARRVHPSIMWAKLQSLAEGARIAHAGALGPARGGLTSPALTDGVMTGRVPAISLGRALCPPIGMPGTTFILGPTGRPDPCAGRRRRIMRFGLNAAVARSGTGSRARPSRRAPWSKRSPPG